MNYIDIVAQFDLKKGDRVWLSSEILGLAMIFRKNKERFDQNALIDAFIDAIGEEGTLLIPTFNFDFSNHGHYDYVNSKGTTGALGNTALKRDDFKRTTHPLHSFAVWGDDRDYLAAMENNNSFGSDSPFGYCIQRHVKQVILGTDYLHALTFMHYAEATCNVPYRYMKTFKGTYTTEDGVAHERSYIYPVRQLEIRPEECSNKIGAIFEQKGVSKKTEIENIVSYKIDDLAAAYLILCDDIINNQCRNIYNFNIDREQIFIYE